MKPFFAASLSCFHWFFYSKDRNEDNEELLDLQDSLLDDYADDYEEYDHDMEPEHMDGDEDDRHSDTDEEKGNDEGHSYHDKLDFDDDDEQDERYKDDDIIRKHSQSSRGSESKNSHHSDRSRTGSID